jgi:hypothetical protein
MGRGGIAVRLVYFGLLGSSSLLWIRVRTFNFLLETEVEMAIWFRTVDWILALTHQQKKKKKIDFYYVLLHTIQLFSYKHGYIKKKISGRIKIRLVFR